MELDKGSNKNKEAVKEALLPEPHIESTEIKTPHTTTINTEPAHDSDAEETEILLRPHLRSIPLPMLAFAESKEVWQNMVYKEEAGSYARSSRLFEDRYNFLPRRRATLLDWIMSVCECYHLRRVTYYLTVDFVDRYLTLRPSTPKNYLQLIGVSALFIASKLEEIYPPKVTEYEYVCDGAFTVNEILCCEVLLLSTLGWDMNPMTPTGWLNLYMQLHYNTEKIAEQCYRHEPSRDFIFPQYSAFQFLQASNLIDLFSLDPGFLLYTYSIIAAAAMYFLYGRKVAMEVSGYKWDDLKDCVEYMSVFYTVLKKTNDVRLVSLPDLKRDERQLASLRALKQTIPDLIQTEDHSIQTHYVDLDIYEKATLCRLEQFGLHVRKIYVKPKQTNENGEFEEVDPNYHDDAIVMFKIEKSVDVRRLGGGEEEREVYCDSEKLDYFTTDTSFSFDQILHGLNYSIISQNIDDTTADTSDDEQRPDVTNS